MTTSAMAQFASPPVHQHHSWRHLQRAAVAARKQFGDVTQSNFCSLMTPPASIAVWILQHAPQLAARASLRILVVNASEFETLDSGRWYQFIPWLLGRPAMKVQVTLLAPDLLKSLDVEVAGSGNVEDGERLEKYLRTRASAAVQGMVPAELSNLTIARWLECADENAPRALDLVVNFNPALALTMESQLHDDMLPVPMRAGVPLALFAASEVDQRLDAYLLEAHGWAPRDRDFWPNPWALPSESGDRSVTFANFGWAPGPVSDPAAMPVRARADARALADLREAIRYAGPLEVVRENEILLTFGEPLRTAPREGCESEAGSPLWRLPRGAAVDSTNGHVYQLQDSTALLLDSVPQVPLAALESHPGHDDLIRRAIWASEVHRDHVAPYAELVDDALRSQFAKLG